MSDAERELGDRALAPLFGVEGVVGLFLSVL